MALLELVTSHAHLKDGEIGPFTGNVLLQLANNASVVIAPERIAKLRLLKEDYESKHIVSIDGNKADVLKKNEAKAALTTDLNELAVEVCVIAKGDREKLATTGFILVKETEKGKEPPKPTNFKVEYGINEGSLIFSVKSHADARIYVFLFISADSTLLDLSAWSQISSTSSKKEITGFKHGVDYLCRCAYMGPKGKLIYSDAISVLAR